MNRIVNYSDICSPDSEQRHRAIHRVHKGLRTVESAKKRMKKIRVKNI